MLSIKMRYQPKRCPFCGKRMSHHISGEFVYWICNNCKKEQIVPKIAEIEAGHLQ